MIQVRCMIRRDLKEVLKIEKDCYSGAAWDSEDFTDTLCGRSYLNIVAEDGEDVLGFLVAEIRDDKYHIMNMGVSPSNRKEGVGAALINKMKDRLPKRGRRRMTVCVRESNLEAQLFFQKMDFLAIRTHRGYYSDNGEDAYRFQYYVPKVKATSTEDHHGDERILADRSY